ncbi:hypothetical protein K2X33_01720 [bacterium]|nr:hypothetical protein [bacterium]
MKTLSLTAVLLALSQTTWAMPRWGADITLTPAGALRGQPSRLHGEAQRTHYEILDSDSCVVKKASNGTLEVGKCGYLEGVYQYSYSPEGARARRVSLGFSLRRDSANSHSLLVSPPLELVEP